MICRFLNCVAVGAFLLVASCAVTFAADSPASPEQVRFFEAKIRPLLVANCYKCHGEKKQNGKLRLDSRAMLLAGGESGAAIVAGKPEKSLLIEAINYESLEMPPKGKLKDDQIALLTDWVRMGAPWPDDGAVKPVASRPKITDEDRAYWAFQPVKNVTPPEIDAVWCKYDIDRFIYRKLQSEGLSPSPAAESLALLRRVYFDLLGLPPTPKEIDEFLSDQSGDAYERLIDRLLDDSRYGERWARHWLDLVRYAESDGYKQDAFRPHAWRYRDYVIRSFNDDKPYDRFVMEQLAGDEIAPQDPDAIVATGYLRHWIYEYNQRDVRTQWDTILNDITDVTGDVFLAMGMGCARCHDHKFDPILQKDYYRLKSFFAPLMPREDLPLGTADEVSEYLAKQTEWESATAEIRRQLEEIERPHIVRAARPAINKFPPDIRPMMAKPASERLPLEHQLAEFAYRQASTEIDKLNFESKLKGEEKSRWQELKKQLADYDHLKPKPLPFAVTVTDVGPVAPPTAIPGDRNDQDIAPGFLSVINPDNAQIVRPPMVSNSTGRRTALASWITSRDNPLTTRVIVNRIWQYHFGRGLVATSSDFGRLGEPPSHPELLDWLTTQFIEGGWKFKKLHRLIMTSATYRQSALRESPEVARLKDPGNRWLWKMNVRRLDAEQIRDAMLAVSGELDGKRSGPSVDTSSPRRTIYTKVFRNNRDPLLDVFDAPDNFNSTSDRNVTTTPTQSLLMINGAWTLDRARALASRLQRMQLNDAQLVDRAYRLAYGRHPTPVQREAATAFLAWQSKRIGADVKKPPQPVTEIITERNGKAAALDPMSDQRRLHVPNSDSLPTGDFTIEAVILLRSLYEDATVRTIAAHWDNQQQHPGWSLGVTSTKSKYKPRNLILQLVGDPKKGGAGYEVVASNLRPELDKPYYVAVSVKIADTSKQGITFYMKNLSQSDATLQTANVAHKVTGHYRSSADFTIGGRDRTTRHYWHGLIDDVRLSNAALPQEQLLVNDGSKKSAVVGHWCFEDKPGILVDSSACKNDIQRTSDNSPVDPRTAALIDFCHVMLNSNEFLYVD